MLKAVFMLLVLAGLALLFFLVRRFAGGRYAGKQARMRLQKSEEPPSANLGEPEYELVHNAWENGSGYTMLRLADGQRLAWETLPKKDGFQCLEVVGESHHRKDLQQSGFAAGFPIRLMPEPENPVDPDAVAVRDASGKYHAGYLSRQDAPKILKRIRNGIGFQAMVMWEV